MPRQHEYNTNSTEFWAAKYDSARDMYRARQLTPDQFRGMLYRLGFRGQEIEAEVRLCQPPTAGNLKEKRS